jgi:flagellar biosynthetic protein FlhB
VALRYDEARMRAPVVVAKGADLVAQRIRELAREHGVPLVEAPPLARALHGSCELGDEIPARLYAVVAQVLTYVYQLRTARHSGAVPPAPPVVDTPEPTEL